MLEIQDSRIFKVGKKFHCECVNCGKECSFTTKNSALKMLERKSCRYCKRDYRNVDDSVSVYRNSDGKWCSTCSSCGSEQAYTRKDHAKQSELADWQCKSCIAKAKGFSKNAPVGNGKRLYNKFRKSANSRGIKWDINYNDFMSCFDKKCALTGWDITMDWEGCNASLDRIDSLKGYTKDNIQWIHVMVNMCKNKYKQENFISMCVDIAKMAGK